MNRTSQFSRMKQRAEAADFSGGNASADSLTPRSANLAAEDARDLRFGLLLDVALGSVVSSEELVRFLFPFLSTDWMKLTLALRSTSGLQEMKRLDESPRISKFPYR